MGTPMYPPRWGQKDDSGDDDKDVAAVTAELQRISTQVKDFAEKANKEISETGKLSTETKARVDEVLTRQSELSARLTEVEQKLVRRGSPEQSTAKTLGEIVCEHEEVKGLTSGSRGSARVRIDRKAIISATSTVGAGVSPGTSLVPGDRVPGIIMPPDRTMTVRNLLMPGETNSSNVEYVRETGFTNNAGMVAENTTKPTSDITFNLLSAPVRTIAHIFKASRQILDDAPMLRSYIDGRARYGLRYKEEQQLLTGDGTGQNILGIIPQATAFTAPVTIAGATPIDRIRLAILQAALAEYPVTGIVLHPTDWAVIELTKDNEGRYIIASPQSATMPTLWGLPVVSTQAIAQDTFLVGSFAMGAQIFDRMDIEVLISTENVDDFEKNMVTIRAEERLALAVYRPEAFVTGEVVPGV